MLRLIMLLLLIITNITTNINIILPGEHANIRLVDSYVNNGQDDHSNIVNEKTIFNLN